MLRLVEAQNGHIQELKPKHFLGFTFCDQAAMNQTQISGSRTNFGLKVKWKNLRKSEAKTSRVALVPESAPGRQMWGVGVQGPVGICSIEGWDLLSIISTILS